MNAFLSSILSGFTAGVTVLILELLYKRHQEAKRDERQRVISVSPCSQIVSMGALARLRPGTSIDNMKSLLGVPLQVSSRAYSLFQEEEVEVFNYLYVFSNVAIRIVSVDNQTVTSLTILFITQNDKDFSFAIFPFSIKHEKMKDWPKVSDAVDYVLKQTEIRTRIDACTAIQTFVSNPLYSYYCFFIDGVGLSVDEVRKEDIKGVCISDKEEHTYFIYDMELRFDL